MQTKYLFLCLLIALTITLSGIQVSESQIKRVAQNIGIERSGQFREIQSIDFLNQDTKTQIYVAHFIPSGFALIAGDDASYPILGYDFTNDWTGENIPIQLQDFLNSWVRQLDYIVENHLTADNTIRTEWQRLSVESAQFTPQRFDRAVAPLMNTIWGQEGYYNYLCPPNTPVGCVAVAMGQIMKYWSYPLHGQGSHSYNHPNYGTQSADFGNSTYLWSTMPISLSSYNAEVDSILYHCGVAVDMDYAPGGSGAYSTDVPSAMINYFNYKNTIAFHYKSSYSAATWESMMRTELDNARPVYYDGSGPSGGHAFVMDGYSGTNYFHFNWGWYGYYNGYFYLTALNPGGEDYTTGQGAIIGIRPSETVSLLGEGFEGTIWPPTNWTITPSSTFSQSSTSPIAGTYSARYAPTGQTGAAASGKQLRTPKLTVNSTSAPITFKAKRGTSDRGEQFKVGYSASATGPYTYLTTFTLTATALTFTQVVTGIPAGDYYFVFETYSASTGTQNKYWTIDEVTGPTLWLDPTPLAALNSLSWSAGSVAPGEATSSGLTFQLSNNRGGTLSITSVTDLSSSEFKCDINTGVQLVAGQVHEFGFTYEPINYGTDSQNFQIITNGGTVTISLGGSGEYNVLYDSFESYPDFSLAFSPWTQYDGDGGETYTIQDVTFDNMGYTGSYIIFNPDTTTPATGLAEAHSGAKYAACFNAVTGSNPNNDWLISSQVTVTTGATVSFWAKSYTDTYGMERFKVLTSTTTNAYTSFTTYLAGGASTFIEAPVTWTYYSYNLPNSFSGYIAIQCVSNDAFFFMVDDFKVVDASTPPAPSFGHVDGYVYKYGTSTPIANALITIGSKTDYTDTNGYYKISNLVVGTYSVICSAPGMFYFESTTTGVGVTMNNTTRQNCYLTWAEMSVLPTSESISLYSSETEDRTITISNPAGTADLLYAVVLSDAATRYESNVGELRRRALSPYMHRVNLASISRDERVTGWMGYADINDIDLYTSAVPQRATKFTISDFAMFTEGVTISKINHYFYEPSTDLWGTNDKFYIKIYAANGTTLLHTSAQLTAQRYPTVTEYILPTPLYVTGDYWVSIQPVDGTNGKPFTLLTDYYYGNSYIGNGTTWSLEGGEFVTYAYIVGAEWLTITPTSGTVAPAASQNLTLHVDTTNLPAGTKYANLTVYNNSNYIAPSSRGDNLIIPISLTVTIPSVPFVALNNSICDINTVVGTPISSGSVFQIKNVGVGTLTITSATGLTGTPFTTTFNSAITLTLGQTHNFGFTYNPTGPGMHTATFTIVTNGGTKLITLTAHAVGTDYLSENFAGTIFPPAGWVSYDVDGDGNNWFSYSIDGIAHSDTTVAGSASYINASRNETTRNGTRPALTPDNWLVTPRLAVGSTGVLAYWIAAQDPDWPSEHYSVWLSPTNNQVASFTIELFAETLADAEWHQRAIDLSAYANSNIYLAFRHHDCTDEFVLKLDDVQMPPLSPVLQDAEIPVNITIHRPNAANNNVQIKWDESDNALCYHVYACNEPLAFDQYVLVTTTADLSATITPANLTSVGITGITAFFRVTADNEALRNPIIMRKDAINANQKSKNSNKLPHRKN